MWGTSLKISVGSHQTVFADLWFYEVKREETTARGNPGTRQHLEAGRMAGTVARGLVHSESAPICVTEEVGASSCLLVEFLEQLTFEVRFITSLRTRGQGSFVNI